MSVQTVTVEAIDLLKKLAKREGKDAHRTMGRAALKSHGEVAIVRHLEHQGLIVIDESNAPILSSFEYGEAWAVFTDAGRQALVETPVHEAAMPQ